MSLDPKIFKKISSDEKMKYLGIFKKDGTYYKKCFICDDNMWFWLTVRKWTCKCGNEEILEKI